MGQIVRPLEYIFAPGQDIKIESLETKSIDIEIIQNAIDSYYFEPSQRERFIPPEDILFQEEIPCAAVDTNDPEIFRLFIEYGLDANASIARAISPLHEAVCAGLETMTAFLLQNGAEVDVMVMDPDGTHLGAAASRKGMAILRMLLQHGAKVEKSHALEEAVKTGNGPNAEILLEAAADINEIFTRSQWVASQREQPGYTKQVVVETALHAAIKKGHVEFAKWLVLRGADRPF
ncbi:hypothetical protein MMC18_008990 [Xylographa bjoerkii]|nr:hypothetical protein [Xylographa bjoerkii]